MCVLYFVFAIFSDEPNSTRLQFLQNREKEIHDELLSTVIRVIEPQLKHFNELIRNPPKVCNKYFLFYHDMSDVSSHSLVRLDVVSTIDAELFPK